MTRKALGRGIRALIPDPNTETSVEGSVMVKVEEIIAAKSQPRQWFDPERLQQLADSIIRQGILQPIIVRRSGERYEIVAGERRLRAAVRAGLTSVPAVVKELGDEEAAEIALIENVHREDLNPIEKAQAFRRLMQEFNLTQEEVSEKVGSDRSSVANFVRLLQLPPEIQEVVSRGTLTMGHARALLSVPEPQRQKELAQQAVSRDLSVRDLERAAREALRRPSRPKGPRSRQSPYSTYDPNEIDLLNRAQRYLGTRVRLRRTGTGNGGEIVVEYYSNADLDRLFRKMGILGDGSPLQGGGNVGPQ